VPNSSADNKNQPQASDQPVTERHFVEPALRTRLAGLHDPMALLEGLFASSPVPYIIFGADGFRVANNRAYRAMFGREPPPEYNVLHDEIAARTGLADAVSRAFGGESVQTPPMWYDPRELAHVSVDDARRVAFACTFFPLYAASGAVAFVAVAFKDVTEEFLAREQAEAELVRMQAAIVEKDRLATALRESEERLRSTLEAAEVGTWEWKLADNSVKWSSNIERIFGLLHGSFAGTYEAWLALVHPEDREGIQAKIAHSLSTLAPYEAEFRFLRTDKKPGWQSTRGYVVAGADGRPELLRGVVFDVSARRRLAESLLENEARYRSFVAQSTEGIWRFEIEPPISVALSAVEQVELVYQRACLAECNDAMARMYGFERADQLLGRRLGDLLVREDPRTTEYLLGFIEQGYRLEAAESYELDREGRRRVFQNSLVGTIEAGAIRRAWGTQRDITAEIDARQQAEAANRAKDEFLALLGHELRNPLAPILTALELMKLRDAEALAKERAVIERQVKHVVRLVDDLLDVSRITRGKVSIERKPIELADALAAAIELTSPLLEQRAHRLTVSVPRGLMVEGDPLRLAQVFTNLLMNAAKYTPQGGSVTILGQRFGDRARIVVRDTGIGIRPEILPRVFDLFVQERQALDRSEGGLGLGLAIVRSLVELHGGSVAASSQGPGHGSEFFVELPVSLPLCKLESQRPPAEPAKRPDGFRILVVDDNEDAADLLAGLLQTWGHTVEVAYDGPSALKLVEAFTPRVALLDIGLPAMDGYELARRLRALPQLHALHLIAVTGYGQAKDREAAEQAGFHAHIVKPVNSSTLDSMLSAVMQQVGSQ
jgi:PAS domain S-box-containing protein